MSVYSRSLTHVPIETNLFPVSIKLIRICWRWQEWTNRQFQHIGSTHEHRMLFFLYWGLPQNLSEHFKLYICCIYLCIMYRRSQSMGEHSDHESTRWRMYCSGCRGQQLKTRTVDPRMNGLTEGVGSPTMPIVRYFRIMCVHLCVCVCVCVCVHIYIV
jgi:hypothetical protein